MAVRTVRRDTAGLGTESLTFCQANRIKVAARTVKRDITPSDMKSLTCCQANRIIKRGSEDSEKGHSWT